MSSRTYAVSTTVDRPASSMETKAKKHCQGPWLVYVYFCLVRSQCSARVRTSARYHGYGAYFTFLWHNSFYNVLPDPSLGLGLASETNIGRHYRASLIKFFWWRFTPGRQQKVAMCTKRLNCLNQLLVVLGSFC